MRRKWITLDEWIFAIERHRENAGIRVLVDNANRRRDSRFAEAVAGVIAVWIKEVAPCPKSKRPA